MFLLRKSQQLSNKEMQPGQTLFQYLKRKKQIALKQSVQKELQKKGHQQKRQIQNSSVATTFVQKRQTQKQPSTILESARSRKSTKRRLRKSSNKKKKQIDSSFQSCKNSKKQKQNNFSLMNVMDNEIFKDDKTTRRRSTLHYRQDNNLSVIEKKCVEDESNQPCKTSRSPFRSFISMISPLKNRCENNPSTSLSNKKYFQKQQYQSDQQHINKKAPLAKFPQFSTKKSIKQAINKVQIYCNKKNEFQINIKQKVREFILSMNSFLVQVENDLLESSNKIQKKMKEVKTEMKLLNSFLQPNIKQEQSNNYEISSIIDFLYQEINKTLNEYEGKVSKNTQFTCQQSIQKMKQQFQQKIQELNKEKSRLGRQIGSINKERGKIERDYDKLLTKYNETMQQTEKIKKIQKQQEQEISQSYEEQIKQIAKENQALKQSLKVTQKNLKQVQHKFQEYKRKIQTQRTQKTTAREDYLLKQIASIRQQCAKDINNINTYYLNKLEHYPGKIKALEDTVEEQKKRIFQINETLAHLENTLKSEEKEKKEIKRKLQQSLIDMCKMNQELFKHWLALKDVKTLSLRLAMFDKFERIYRDVPFDDRMFLL